jgi:hypothetical protein
MKIVLDTVLYVLVMLLAMSALAKIACVRNGIERMSFLALLGAISWVALGDGIRTLWGIDMMWWRWVTWMPLALALLFMNLIMLGYFEE